MLAKAKALKLLENADQQYTKSTAHFNTLLISVELVTLVVCQQIHAQKQKLIVIVIASDKHSATREPGKSQSQSGSMSNDGSLRLAFRPRHAKGSTRAGFAQTASK